MIADFLASWALFHHTYLVGWLIALVLPLVGVLVVARNQIFIGAAVSQASTFGIAVGMFLGDVTAGGRLAWLAGDGFLAVMAVAFSVLAALATAGGQAGRNGHEAITGWVFLLSASLAILVVSHSPHGLEEIHRLVASSIIGATAVDLWTFAALAAVTAAAVAARHRRLLLFAMDPAMAAAVGVPVRAWALGTSLWLGLVVGLAIRVSGILYAFGCLVLPPLVARSLCREVRPMFVVAPLVSVGTGVVGFVLAHHYDFPPGQMTVALLAGLVALGWLLPPLRPRRAP
jgi:zinc/manganese transport system permease protein